MNKKGKIISLTLKVIMVVFLLISLLVAGFVDKTTEQT